MTHPLKFIGKPINMTSEANLAAKNGGSCTQRDTTNTHYYGINEYCIICHCQCHDTWQKERNW